MAFQDNSGDIILDIVLTDEGRRRLALANDSFNIVKFALSDDEINYTLFDKESTTALQDLSILQTPLLEAFTNNMASMKNKLVSLPNPRLLYMPILKLNTVANTSVKTHENGNFVVTTNQDTTDDRPSGRTKSIAYDSNDDIREGFIHGVSTDERGSYIKVDAGIHSTAVSEIDETLVETEFSIEIDSRLGAIVDKTGLNVLSPTSIDDDYIATYRMVKEDGSPFVFTPSSEALLASSSPIDGPISTTLEFKIRSSQDLRVSDFLFNRIGSTASYSNREVAGTTNVKIIDSIVRVTGHTTGFALDIPVRFAKI